MLPRYDNYKPPSHEEMARLGLSKKAIRKIVDMWLDEFGEGQLTSVAQLLRSPLGEFIALEGWPIGGNRRWGEVIDPPDLLYPRRIRGWGQYFSEHCLFTFGSHNDYILMDVIPDGWALRRVISIPQFDVAYEQGLLLKCRYAALLRQRLKIEERVDFPYPYSIKAG